MSETADSCTTKSTKKNASVEAIRAGLIFFLLYFLAVGDAVGEGAGDPLGRAEVVGAGSGAAVT